MSQELLAQLDAFLIDEGPLPALSFAARLARENGWSRSYTNRVIREYKRFVYLTATAHHSVTPSVQVDAAWHLHLTYTKSYWNRMCGEVLKKPLHHEPTTGGRANAEKYLRNYEATLASYRAAFGHEPPEDIWPPAATRFGEDQAFTTVNTARNWVVPKARARQLGLALCLALVAVVFGTGCFGEFNPLNLKGTAFLALFGSLYALMFAFGIAFYMTRGRPNAIEGEQLPQLHSDELAELIGGRPRVALTAVVNLSERGALKFDETTNKIQAVGNLPADPRPAEQLTFDTVSANPAGVTFTDVRNAIVAHQDLGLERLDDEQLLATSSARFYGRVIPLVGWLSILMLAFGKLFIGVERGKPIGFLIAGIVLTVITMIVFLCIPLRRTGRGNAVVRQATKNYYANKVTGNADHALGTAVFGMSAMTGVIMYSHFTEHIRRDCQGESGNVHTDTSSGGGGGGDGGGCGGGGCGGCS
ncbi:MAG: TIGR04222 domain-containing membrane protein [Fimbriiglobus sp.]